MTDDELKREVKKLASRVADLEQDHEQLMDLPDAVARLEGAVGVLKDLVTNGFKSTSDGLEKAAGLKTAVAFASVVIVPILVAVIGGYFALKGAAAPD